ncbi:filamentous hemagglutinin N-terminal domain-containing protein [Iningainema tapete]|uniref:Filamentous hemagglutinin N-terminal domain-containing protein n=1 Tax=Iningainema tapete BLCC-T55 TaxID=2748662 RepID=A0A8J7BYH2_9CYAN|nr:filamentous hemagglutinin N-terminal domain-containing protein [Iningainema tapete]MBD2774093.1 filamentous hemagglutinin N-terminal domain-containing protein [Iningainema tapete BLCC-T55]
MKAKSWYWWLKIAVLLLASSISTAFSRTVYAQIIPDATLGRENSLVTPQGVKDLITGGAIRDTTLFHSFREFNVNNGQQVYFASPNGVTNIFTRVSGSNISRIFGTLGVNGSANLFFMNPNGIIFGANAKLDLRGSFTATTATRVNIDKYTFSADNPTTPPLLKINVTPGLQYGSITPNGQIRNQGNLSVGQDLNLIGSNLNLQGQLRAGENLNVVGNTVTIRDSTSKPFIATAGSNLVLQGNQKLDIFVLNHPDSGLFSGRDMVLRSANPVAGDAHYTSYGSFRLEKVPESLSLSSPSQQGSGMGSLSSSDDPVIRSGGDVSIGSYTGASLHIIAGGKVEIPNITITKADTDSGIVENVALSDGTSVAISGNTKPTLDIRAGVSPSAIAPSMSALGNPGFSNLIVTNTNTSADIKVGSILFADTANKPITGQVLLTNQYYPNPNLAGDIQINGTVVTGGGAVNIDSKGSIIGNSLIDTNATTVNEQYLGNGGDVRLLANGNITFNPSSGINSVGLLSGNITLTSNGDISFNNAKISSDNYTNVPSITGGDINVTASSVFLSNGSEWQGRTFGAGNAGSVKITASESVSLFNDNSISSEVEAGAVGNAGGVDLNASSVSLTNGAQIASSTNGLGDAGGVRLNVTKDFLASGENSQGFVSGVFSSVNSGVVGNAGKIDLDAGSVSLTNGAQIASSTNGQGDAGGVRLNVTKDFFAYGESSQGFVSGVFSSVDPEGVGHAGKIDLDAGSVSLTNGARIISSTFGLGDAGGVRLNVTRYLQASGESSQGIVSGVFSSVEPGAVGNASGVDLDAGSVSLTNGAQIVSSTFGTADAGRVRLNVTGDFLANGESSQGFVSGVFSSVESLAVGNAGGVDLDAGSVSLNNRAQINSSTFGQGNAGGVRLNVTRDLQANEASGVFSTVDTLALGNAGGVALNAGSVSLTNGARINSTIFGKGDAGGVRLNVTGDFQATGENSQGGSGVFSSVEPGAVGNASGVDLDAGSVSLNNGAQIVSAIFGLGNAGGIRLNVTRDFFANGENSQGFVSGVFSSVESGGVGNAGNIDLDAGSVSLTNGAQIISSTFGLGDAGGVRLSVTGDFFANGENSKGGSGVLSTVEAGATGKGGNIELSVGSVSLRNGGQISSSTYGQGNAGDLKINISGKVQVDGESRQGISSQISSSANFSSIGNAGNIDLSAASIELTNGGSITTAANGNGTSNAGNIAITSNQLRLSDRSNISATTLLGDGGNIFLNLKDFLLLRNHSNISTTAGQANAGGNGGNININSGFLVAVPGEDSDISANAYNGSGGNINITTNGIYGIQYRTQNTDFSDITATSQFGINGTVNFIIPEIDPTAGLTQLPLAIIDPADQIIAGCPTDRDARFVVTGRGSIPEDPRQALRGQVVMQDFRSPAVVRSGADKFPLPPKVSTPSYPHSPIVEATGWVMDLQGNIILVANLPDVSHSSWSDKINCPSVKW